MSRYRRCLNVALLGLTLGLGAAGALAQGQDAAQGEPNRVKLEVGRSKVVKSPWPVTRVSVADSEIADVQVLSPSEVLVVGKKIGVTDLVLWNDDGQTWEAIVDVELDLRRFERELSEYFPTASLSLSKSGEVVVVRGTLRRIEDAEHLTQVMQNVLNDKEGKRYVNLTGVSGVQQVMVKVKIAEARRNALRSLGVDVQYNGKEFLGTSRPAGNLGLPQIDEADDTLTNTFGSAATLFGSFPQADLDVLVEALIDNQYIRLLAEPSLVALSGEEASFLAGGEFPIPVVQGSGGGSGGSDAISVTFKEFGVRLSFRPTVLGDGKIRLKIAPEVSELSDVGRIQSGGFSIPSVLTRRSETTLELNSGQSFAMAGLLNRTTSATARKVPGFGELPIIGTMFRSVRYQRGETELLVLATVELVEPLSIANGEGRPLPGDQHVEPSDWELYLDGRIQGKAPIAAPPTHAGTFKRMGLDQLQGPGAWERHGQPSAPNRAPPRVRRSAPQPTAASPAAAADQQGTSTREGGHD